MARARVEDNQARRIVKWIVEHNRVPYTDVLVRPAGAIGVRIRDLRRDLEALGDLAKDRVAVVEVRLLDQRRP